jgi:glyoxylase I family protein
MNIEHVALNVPDPAAMAAWYTSHLGMRVLRSMPTSPFTHFLADQSGRVVIEIYHHTRAAIADYFSFESSGGPWTTWRLWPWPTRW